MKKSKIIDKYIEYSKLLKFSPNSVKQKFTNTGTDDNNFTVAFEVIVLNRISEDDYGLVFSTTMSNKEQPCLISDVCYGNGEIISEIEILIASSYNGLTKFEFFIKSQFENAPKIMMERYSLRS